MDIQPSAVGEMVDPTDVDLNDRFSPENLGTGDKCVSPLLPLTPCTHLLQRVDPLLQEPVLCSQSLWWRREHTHTHI